MARQLLLLCCLAACLACVDRAFAQDPDYVLSLTEAAGAPGSEQGVGVRLDCPSASENLAGWALGVCHDEPLVDIVSAVEGSTTATINLGEPPDFHQINVRRNGTARLGTAGCNQAVVISFLGLAWLEPGSNYELLDLSYSLIGTAGSTATTYFCDTILGGVSFVTTVLTPVGGASSIFPTVVPGSITIEATAVEFLRGDCNSDGTTDVVDISFALEYLFVHGSTRTCADACDGDDNGQVDIADAVYIASALFSGGAPIPEPSTACGSDPTDDGLECDTAACP